ncbi:hypothetical protein CPC08DRAFT_39647 [Agrocybe pediades]|nr:hypothetical protein CPC08DRAFT_39647 [Agrocybe pediades]
MFIFSRFATYQTQQVYCLVYSDGSFPVLRKLMKGIQKLGTASWGEKVTQVDWPCCRMKSQQSCDATKTHMSLLYPSYLFGERSGALRSTSLPTSPFEASKILKNILRRSSTSKGTLMYIEPFSALISKEPCVLSSGNGLSAKSENKDCNEAFTMCCTRMWHNGRGNELHRYCVTILSQKYCF